MEKEFYHMNKLVFHCGLIANGREHGWDIISNIPIEIFNRNDLVIKKLNLEQSKLHRSPSDYLDEIGKIIKLDQYSKYFYYPSFLFENTSMIQSELFDKLFNLSKGFVLLPGKYYSQLNEPMRLYILIQKYFLLKFFYKEVFSSELLFCSRKSFEDVLPNCAAEKEYVDLFAASNEFFVFLNRTDPLALPRILWRTQVVGSVNGVCGVLCQLHRKERKIPHNDGTRFAGLNGQPLEVIASGVGKCLFVAVVVAFVICQRRHGRGGRRKAPHRIASKRVWLKLIATKPRQLVAVRYLSVVRRWRCFLDCTLYAEKKRVLRVDRAVRYADGIQNLLRGCIWRV